MSSPKKAPRRKVFGWSAPKLSDAYTLAELEEIRQEIISDPANLNPEQNSIYIYCKQARRKLDALAWAVTYRLGEKKRAAHAA